MALKYIGLVPNNEEAWEICRLPQNHRHIIYDANSSQPMALGLDIDGRHKDSAIVATIGRHSSHNIVLPFSNETSSRYSRNQCTFFHNRANGELLVEDDSKTYTTHLEYEDPALSMFQFDGHPRRRMVKYPAKLYIWFSKAKFQLLINTDPDVSTTKRALMRLPVSNSNAPTNLLVPELPKTRRQTRVSTPLIHAEQPKIIWNGVCELGRGQTGVVWSALNLLNGDHLAVKVIKTRRDDIDEKTLKEAVKAQIQTLQQLNHVRYS